MHRAQREAWRVSFEPRMSEAEYEAAARFVIVACAVAMLYLIFG